MTGVSVVDAAGGFKPLNVPSNQAFRSGPRERRRFAGIERKEALPPAGQFDDDALAAALAPHDSRRFETLHVIRGAARGRKQDLVKLADGPRVLEGSEELRALNAHERTQRRRRWLGAAHAGFAWTWRVVSVCSLHRLTPSLRARPAGGVGLVVRRVAVPGMDSRARHGRSGLRGEGALEQGASYTRSFGPIAPDWKARSTSLARFWFWGTAPTSNFSNRARMWVFTASTER
jgi:hypothetical protein